jgi:arylsulfatase A-like enzyme
LITDNAIEWIKNRDVTKPFFAMVHHKAPHTPYRYPEKYKKLFADIEFEEPETFYDEFEGKNAELVNNECVFSKFLTIDPAHFAEEVPDTIEYGTLAYKKWGYQSILKGYYRLVTAMDENIGRLMDFVDESGLAENTIVIYTSDNGWFMGDHGLFNKMWMYDESLRVPLIVRYPGKIKAGSVNDDIVSVLDFGPTFKDYAGMDEDKRFQGTSFKDILHGRAPKNRESAHFYHYFGQWGVPSHYGVRTEDYKLIHFYEAKEEPKWELYDMKKDPKEMVNLVYNDEYKTVFEDMKKQLEERKRLCEETPIEQ